MSNKILNKVLGEIKKTVADDIIVDFSKGYEDLKILTSWGSLLVDQIAPLVRGRIYESYGAYSSGKSSLAISACANAVKEGKVAAFIDAECAFNSGFARALGLEVDNPNFVLIQPDNQD